jgi:hypothetical protein
MASSLLNDCLLPSSLSVFFCDLFVPFYPSMLPRMLHNTIIVFFFFFLQTVGELYSSLSDEVLTG